MLPGAYEEATRVQPPSSNMLEDKPLKEVPKALGAQLAFKNLSFHVKLSDGSTKKILTDVSGLIKGGDIMFMMGPSGAGKSSLLDALADRVKSPVEGKIFVNSERKDPLKFKKIAKYVQQEDHLIPVLTVRQTLECLASFYTTNPSLVKERVADAIKLLGLEAQEHTIIGGALLRGLSGGQKRRVSIGCEVVSAPRILFLDEPTSGLDSAAAWNVISALKTIAETKKTTLLITIHQPSERLFRLSDSFLLLSAGRLCYTGSTAAAVPYFQGLKCEMPPMTSSADWMLDLVDTSFNPLEEVEPLMQAWARSGEATRLTAALEQLDAGAEGGADRSEHGWAEAPTATSISMWWQTRILMWRMALNIMKNPAVIWLRFAMYIALSILIGTAWLDVGDDEEAILNIINSIFFISAFMVFMSISVLPAFLEEKAVFIKERANGAYSVTAFSVAHLVVDLPPLFLLALVNGTICYFILGYNSDTDRYLFFILDLFLSFAVAEALCFLVAVVVPSFIVGIAAAAFAYGGFMVVAGFFIPVGQIGWQWRWLHYISLHAYSFSSFMHNEFDGATFSCTGDGMWRCGADGHVHGEFVLEHYDYEDTDKWGNMIVLLADA